MAPLPKRKHSTMRRGKRTAARHAIMPHLVFCTHCMKTKRSHRQCLYCGK